MGAQALLLTGFSAAIKCIKLALRHLAPVLRSSDRAVIVVEFL